VPEGSPLPSDLFRATGLELDIALAREFRHKHPSCGCRRAPGPRCSYVDVSFFNAET
jgi:hypothetical protein